MDARKQALPVFTAVTVLVGIGVILQLWLLSASLEGMLTGEGHVALPATVASAFLFAVNGSLLLYVLRVDRRARAGER